ncbi:MAG: 50S ribosomal protein L4 [Halobacteriales archaeon]|tara:strand:- start:765 stop:1508 length:744 start_codon:yes stop_codon:yes gene_type:complete
MKATLFNLKGTKEGTVDLPSTFNTPYRPDLIQKAVVASQANRKQPYGADPFAGKRTSAVSLGTGRGLAQVPRSNGRGRKSPNTNSGRRCHPPKSTKSYSLKINDKERRLAIRSAIAATANVDLVRSRGHNFDDKITLPIVITDDLSDLTKTKEVIDVLNNIGISSDLDRSASPKVRAGRGKTRGRKYKRSKSILLVTSGKALLAAQNVPGVDAVTASEVNTEDLAPGTHAGRLTIWTESAIKEVENK